MAITQHDMVMGLMHHVPFLEHVAGLRDLSGEERERSLADTVRKWGSWARTALFFVQAHAPDVAPDHTNYAIDFVPQPKTDDPAGRFLYLRIDLGATSEQIEREFRFLVEGFKKGFNGAEKDPGKSGHHDSREFDAEDPWYIYRQVHWEGRSLRDLAEGNTAVTNTREDAAFRSRYRKLERLLKRAEDVISALP